jgi:hypothetical protein
MRTLRLLALTASLLPAAPAHATLIDYGAGLIYDTVQDLTWLDPSYAQPPHTTWHGASAWVADLTYEGYDDWRLPRMLFVPGDLDTEWHRALEQIEGWEFYRDHFGGVFELTTGGPGPFRAPLGYAYVWLDAPSIFTSYQAGGWDFPDHDSSPMAVRPVRAGAPVSRVPEGGTGLLLALGLTGVWGWRLSRKLV